MKIQVWYDNSEEQTGEGGLLFSEPTNMIHALVELRRCQQETGSTNMTIELLDVKEGDV